ncbi:hypothetical protein RvY_03402 [Ramazzottius varieornatus]|uniref:Major facilitator superfamily (MFS) profile domain-containing protein n=1 Tax=Ramazzottius varieornatus TaxID=947166 RepID=A0A1D1URB5_RAMVA|nr:hypothetical protein RvY_03402 [Ramazzottius varieornatus]
MQGRREHSLSASVALAFLAFLLVLTVGTSFPAAVLAAFTGLGYTIFWPVAGTSIPLVVASESVGLPLGTGKLAAYMGCGLTTMASGAILNMNGSTGAVP